MGKAIIRSVIATLALGILLCGVYPLFVTGIGSVFFRDQASGGILRDTKGNPIGARLIGQSFSKAEYFHGRPSAAGNGYDATSSSGSNLGPTNQKFLETLKGNLEKVLQDNPQLQKGKVPTDLVTASGSGLDPHISPDGALVQIERVAKARHASVEKILGLVRAHVEGPQLGLFGEAVVNVLLLNLDLDQQFPLPRK